MAKFNAISLLFVSVILSMINMPHIVYTERLTSNLGVSLGLLSLGNLLNNNRNNNQPNIIPLPIPVPVSIFMLYLKLDINLYYYLNID